MVYSAMDTVMMHSNENVLVLHALRIPVCLLLHFLPLSAPVISFSWGNSPLVCPGSLGYSFFLGTLFGEKQHHCRNDFTEQLEKNSAG